MKVTIELPEGVKVSQVEKYIARRVVAIRTSSANRLAVEALIKAHQDDYDALLKEALKE